jgi:hypothetical protein
MELMGRPWLAAVAFVVLAGCGSAGGSADGLDAGTPDSASTDTGPAPIASQQFGPFAPWAQPIADYMAVGEQ